MSLYRWIITGLVTLALLIVAWVVISGLFVYRESQREESWHQRAVRLTEPQEVEDWRDATRRHHVLEWLRYRPRERQYLIRLYEDRSYVFAVYRAATPKRGMPDRFFEGRADAGQWQRLREALEDPALRSVELGEDFDVRIQAKHADGSRGTYTYRESDYLLLPEPLRRVDEQVLAIIEGLEIQPDRSHARLGPELIYGGGDLAPLVRGLTSDREDVYPSVVSRLLGLGAPGVTALGDALAQGPERRYLPPERYLAILDAVASDPEAAAQLLPRIRVLSAVSGRLPAEDRVRARAQEIIDDLEANAFRRAQLIATGVDLERFRNRPVPDALRQEFEHLRVGIHRKDLRPEMRDRMVALGEDVVPLLLERLRFDRFQRNLFNDPLIEVLSMVAGPEALLFGVTEGFLDASACIPWLEPMGARGVPALLQLLDSRGKYNRQQVARALSETEYASAIRLFAQRLEEKVAMYPEESSTALQRLHRDSAVHLVEILKAHGADDAASIDALVAAFVDHRLPDDLRLAALQALAQLGARAERARAPLRERVGYESGKIHETLLETLRRIDG